MSGQSQKITERCSDCGGTMSVTFEIVNLGVRHVKRDCQDCGAETENRRNVGAFAGP